MKYIFLISCLFVLSGCVTNSPERLDRAQKNEDRSQAASKRAKEHGELPGTLENIEGIRKAEEQAVSFQKSADKDKYNSFWFDLLMSIFSK